MGRYVLSLCEAQGLRPADFTADALEKITYTYTRLEDERDGEGCRSLPCASSRNLLPKKKGGLTTVVLVLLVPFVVVLWCLLLF